MVRRPRGYTGLRHETIGSDILSVVASLQAPEHIFGVEEVAALRAIDPLGWYPIQRLLDLMETIDKHIGRYGLRKMGRTLFKMSHEARVKSAIHSAREVIHGIDGMYHHANRGDGIGGWRVLRFDEGVAELEKTTPHHCAMEEGILIAALEAVGAPSLVEQRECFRNGADACQYVITSSVSGPRWG